MPSSILIDLHTHSLFSDGVLIPAELVRRAEVAGYKAIAITDHADSSNLDFVIPRITQICQQINQLYKITALPGIELTHIHPQVMNKLVHQARDLGAKVIVVHGETIVEPVIPGTNRAALECPIDILAHPGFITNEEADLAARRGIFLEISARKGHCLTNGHVARTAQTIGANLILGSDAHEPGDLLTPDLARKVCLGAGLSLEDYAIMQNQAKEFVEKNNG